MVSETIPTSNAVARKDTFRLRLRRWLWIHVENGIGLILTIQKYRSTLADFYFSATSLLAHEIFYTTALPFLFHLGFCQLARQMTILTSLGGLVAGYLKDYFSLPRPPHGRVRRLETAAENKYDSEPGFVSSHTLESTIISSFVFLYFAVYNLSFDKPYVNVFEVQHNPHLEISWQLVVIAILWFTSVSYGRLYLGMHWPLDVVGGFIGGAALVAFWWAVWIPVDQFILGSSFYFPVIAFFGGFYLLALHPPPLFPTPSFSDTTSHMGVAVGVSIGTWIRVNFGAGNPVMPSHVREFLNLVHCAASSTTSCAENASTPQQWVLRALLSLALFVVQFLVVMILFFIVKEVSKKLLLITVNFFRKRRGEKPVVYGTHNDSPVLPPITFKLAEKKASKDSKDEVISASAVNDESKKGLKNRIVSSTAPESPLQQQSPSNSSDSSDLDDGLSEIEREFVKKAIAAKESAAKNDKPYGQNNLPLPSETVVRYLSYMFAAFVAADWSFYPLEMMGLVSLGRRL